MLMIDKKEEEEEEEEEEEKKIVADKLNYDIWFGLFFDLLASYILSTHFFMLYIH